MNQLLKLFHKKIFVKILMTSFFIVMLEYLGISIILPFLKIVTDPSFMDKSPFILHIKFYTGLETQSSLIYLLALIFAGIFILKTIISFLLYKANASYISKAHCNLAQKIMHQTLNAEYRVFLERAPSKFIGTIQSFTEYATTCLRAFATMCIEGVLFILLFMFALYLNFKIALTLFILVLILSLILKYCIINRILDLGKQRTKENTKLYQIIFYIISAVRDIKIMRMEKHISKDFNNIIEKYTQINAKHFTLQSAPKLLGEMFFVLFVIMFVSFVTILKIDIQQNLAVLMTFAVILLRMVPSLHKIYNSISSYNYCHNGMINLIETSEFLSDHHLQMKKSDVNFNDTFKINNLVYSYGDKSVAIDGVNITIKKNSFVGIVGRSGSGKSTFLDLLAGLLEGKKGDFFLDNNKINPYNSDAIRKYIGYVPQKVTLLDATIEHNISFETAHETNKEALDAASEAANIKDFIMDLPDKYNASAGENGIKMSGGQRQRIGIARALYKKPDIILLDEATSAVDMITEKEIMQSIQKLAGKKTIIFATHRLKAVENCDMILVFDKGKIVGQGKHSQLLASCTIYQQMLNSGKDY